MNDLNSNEEIWRTLIYQEKEFLDFEISTFGQLRNSSTAKIYKQWINHNGYYQVCVSLGDRNKKKVFRIHKAVAETFIPNPENKLQVNHIDGNKLNNNIYNLEWMTNKENQIHAIENGLTHYTKGSDRSDSKLTKEQVKYIRDNYIPRHKEFGCRAMARKFNVAHTVILKVIHNKSYIDI